MNYQELVNNCKSAYLEKNMNKALKYWCDIHDLLDEKLNKFDEYDDENRYKCYQEFHDYMQQFTDDEVYKITDYGKEKAYRDELYNKPYVRIVDITQDKKMSVLDDFLNFYEWGILKTNNNKYTIFDIQCACYIDNGEEFDIQSLINRIVGRAIDYFNDEFEIEDNTDIEYGKKLLEIANKYRKNNKWEQNWLENFKKSLENA